MFKPSKKYSFGDERPVSLYLLELIQNCILDDDDSLPNAE